MQSEEECLLSASYLKNDRCLSAYSTSDEISNTSSGLEIFATDVSDAPEGSENVDYVTKKRARG